MQLLAQGLDAFQQQLAALLDGLACAGQIHAAVAVPLLAEEGTVVRNG